MMITAIAKSARVYALPISSVVLGLLGLRLARRSRKTAARAYVAGAAWRFAFVGLATNGFAVAALLGWLFIAWVQWG